MLNGKIYQFKVTLLETNPPVWRRILVPASFTLPKFHQVLQCAFSWENSHLYSFHINGEEYAEPNPDYDDFELKIKDVRRVTLKSVLDRSPSDFIYAYDFGDNWEHKIELEEVLEPDKHLFYPLCIGGERSFVPEDVGGTSGFEEFLDALDDEHHEDHYQMKMWIGGYYNPDHFDANIINRALQRTQWFPNNGRSKNTRSGILSQRQ